MLKKAQSLIVKFDFYSQQTVGEITKMVGLVKAKYLVPIIDFLDLEANPRSSKTGPVTDGIQESIERDAEVFPLKPREFCWRRRNMRNCSEIGCGLHRTIPTSKEFWTADTTRWPSACIF